MIIKIKNFIFRIIYILVIIYLMIFVPSIWGEKPLVVISGSMKPTLDVGSIVYYHETDINKLEKDDILVYKTKDHIISHRIVEKTDTGFITKGDANRGTDLKEIKKDQVLGKANEWCIPILGYFADFIYTHKYLLVISIIVLIVDLFNDYYKLYKSRLRNKHEKIK